MRRWWSSRCHRLSSRLERPSTRKRASLLGLTPSSKHRPQSIRLSSSTTRRRCTHKMTLTTIHWALQSFNSSRNTPTNLHDLPCSIIISIKICERFLHKKLNKLDRRREEVFPQTPTANKHCLWWKTIWVKVADRKRPLSTMRMNRLQPLVLGPTWSTGLCTINRSTTTWHRSPWIPRAKSFTPRRSRPQNGRQLGNVANS